MKNKLLCGIALLFVLCGQIFAQSMTLDISDITVTPGEPGFFKPGENMTINISINRQNNQTSSNDSLFIMIVLSENNTISNDDYLLEISGNSLNMKPFSEIASGFPTVLTTTQQTRNYNFQVPASLTGNYYIIVRIGQKVNSWGNPNTRATYNILANPTYPPLISNSVKTKSIQVEFSATKNVVYNTAWVGDKNSRAKLIVRSGPPRAYIKISNYDVKNLPKFENTDKIVFDTKIFGTGESELGIPQNGNIKFEVVDINGNPLGNNLPIRWAFNKTVTCDNGEIYNSSSGVEISSTGTLNAVVCSPDYESAENPFSWSFVQDLKEADITLITCDNKPAKHPEAQPFGEKQEISISFDDSDGATLWYHIGDNELLDVAALKSSGIKISSSPKVDVVEGFKGKDIYISIYVEGGNVEMERPKVWKFVRESLPVPVVSPSGIPLKKFSVSERPLKIAASLANTDDLCEEKIYYTDDGSDPLTSNTAKTYNGEIQINNTTTLKFAAKATNRESSIIAEHTYILVADGNGAYFDTKGKGGIDSVEIYTTVDVTELPDMVQLTSPWNAAKKVSVPKADISPLRGNVITIVKTNEYIFEPEKPANTYFEPGIFGKLIGAQYGDENNNDYGNVSVGDSVAPVPNPNAHYEMGGIDANLYESEGRIEWNNDILNVIFSEETDIVDIADIAGKIFKYSAQRHEMEIVKILEHSEPNEIKFEVKLSGETLPVSGDSLYIPENTVRERKSGGAGVTQKSETSVPIQIGRGAGSYKDIKVVTPVIPGNTDPVIVVDFITRDNSQSFNEKLSIELKILDAVGNVVAELKGQNDRKNNIWVEIAEHHKHKTPQIRIIWTGKNRGGRNVGSGAYAAVLTITGPDGLTETVSKTIGVGTKK